MALTIGFLKVASVEQSPNGVLVDLASDDKEIKGTLKLNLSQKELENIEAWGGPLRAGAKLDISLL